ncbi:MAG: NUDIX domain-containing protein [Eubacterium sp.]|nr:NUDIX domain-containing protein [Eubacterium sp.]
MSVKFYEEVEDECLKFAVIIAETEGKYVFCRHRERDTWEIPGGHREPGEEIRETARRELYEETGAVDFDIQPVCVYSVIHKDNFGGQESFGMLYYADIRSFEGELHSEIGEILITDQLPEKWTYPHIQPKLLEEAEKRGFVGRKKVCNGEKGRIIFLNGVTSAGKTSIVEALQNQEDIFFYVVANDLFQEMIGEQYLRKDYWKYLSEVIIMMYHTAKLYSDMGKHVLIDGILVERQEIRPHYQQLLDILKDNPLDIVEIYCPLDICRQRNVIRGDRYETQSQEQADLMAPNIAYSARVDTSIYRPEECAEKIIRELF